VIAAFALAISLHLKNKERPMLSHSML